MIPVGPFQFKIVYDSLTDNHIRIWNQGAIEAWVKKKVLPFCSHGQDYKQYFFWILPLILHVHNPVTYNFKQEAMILREKSKSVFQIKLQNDFVFINFSA